MKERELAPRLRSREPIGTLEKDVPYIIVEIGSGLEPWPAVLGVRNPYRQKILDTPGMRYVGVDANLDRLKQGQGRLRLTDTARRIDPNERVSFVAAEGGGLPFAPDTVSEILVRNVLSDMAIPHEKKIAMMAEAARVLKPSGLLKIIEQITPLDESEVLATVISGSGNAFASVEPAALSQGDKENDEQMLELQRYPQARILLLTKRPK